MVMLKISDEITQNANDTVGKMRFRAPEVCVSRKDYLNPVNLMLVAIIVILLAIIAWG